MTPTRLQKPNRTGEGESLLGDARNVDEQAQRDGSQKAPSPEPVAIRIMSVMVSFSSVGLFTASIGALIPMLERYYHIDDAKVARIFVVNVIGYLLGAAILERIHRFAGRYGVALTTTVLHISGIAVLATKPLYSVALAAFFVFSIGTGCADAGFCAWAANVHNANVVQGLIHGSFSVGCVIGPIIVATLAKMELGWNVFYMIMLGAFGTEFLALLYAFRHDDGATYRAAASHESGREVKLSEGRTPIIYCALFYFCYIAMETSLSAWLVTFMTRSRDSSNFIAALTSSIFWGGMAIGRFTLAPMAKAAGGLRMIVTAYIGLSIVFQILFRYDFHIAVFLTLSAGIGFSFGPMFPAGVLMLTSQLPTSLQVRGCSIAASVGQLGGASAPFFLGLIVESWGIERLLDLVLIISILLLLIWVGFSNPVRQLVKPVES